MHNKSFKLDQVLKYRKEMEKVSKLEFAEAKLELDNASSLLKCEEEKADRLNSEFMDRQQKGITGFEFQIYSRFSRKKSEDIKDQRANVGLLNHDVIKKRETLLDASKGKKMLETLEKKSSQARKRAIAVKENHLMEENALRRKGKL
jgi:flagellar FliJ protein